MSASEGWAIGFGPPGEVGEGDYDVLHTRDAGRTWVELPQTYSHNEAPSVSFASSREGWVRVRDVVSAETRLMQTRDGGRRWRRLPLRDFYVTSIQYVGRGVGVAAGFDIYRKVGKFWATRDYGRHWVERPLPNDFDTNLVVFTDANHGLLAGCANHEAGILRTADGGRTWSAPAIELPRAQGDAAACEYYVDDLVLGGDGVGQALVSKHVFASSDAAGFMEAFETADGGQSWKSIARRTSSAAPIEPSKQPAWENIPFYSALRRLGGVLVLVDDSNQLSYSGDDGHTWMPAGLLRALSTCQLFERTLSCGAQGGDGFWIAKIAPSVPPR